MSSQVVSSPVVKSDRNAPHAILSIAAALCFIACSATACLAQGNSAPANQTPANQTPSTQEPSNERPHILIVYIDDMGIGDLGCWNGDIVDTPHIDRLATQGTRFERYYSASPICSPSRCGLLTGMFPARWNITSYLQTRRGNAGCEQADFLDPNAPSLARVLKNAGYHTAHFGKWHLGGGRDVDNAPPFSAYGYDEHAGTWESPEPHPDITASDWIWSDNDTVKRWDRTAFFFYKTLDFLDRHGDEPCFVNIWLDDVHTPSVPDAISDRKDTLPNLVQVTETLDAQIGRLVAELDINPLLVLKDGAVAVDALIKMRTP